MGMSASQGRLLFMTARLSNNEFEQQCVAFSKQRLADSSQAANDEYLDALQATKYQVLTGYNGTEATYTDVTYNQLTGYFGDSTVALGGIGENLFATQNTGVAANKQYIVRDNKGQILVTKAIAEAFKKSQGDYNKFLELMGINDGFENGYTQVSEQNIRQQDVHEAWDKYLVSVGRGVNADETEHIHPVGFYYNSGTNREKNAIEYPTYKTASVTSNFKDMNGKDISEQLWMWGEDNGDYNSQLTYNVNNYKIIGDPEEYIADDNSTKYKVRIQLANQKNTDEYTYLSFDNKPGEDQKYINRLGQLTTEYADMGVTPSSTSEEILFFEGSTAEQRELYDYAVAISKQFSLPDSEKMTYDAGKIKYYQNIYNQMTTAGFTTYQEMLDKDYIQSNENNEKIAYQDDKWLISQLKRGKLNIAYYSAVEKEFVSTTLDDDESITEKEDKSKIAIAEAVYNNKMDKLEAQDKQYDLTLNRLEAEHSALQTEYDAVAKVISKNVEKSFNIFNA